jgi:hypothetical protein
MPPESETLVLLTAITARLVPDTSQSVALRAPPPTSKPAAVEMTVTLRSATEPAVTRTP